jgi:hypothetical protein
MMLWVRCLYLNGILYIYTHIWADFCVLVDLGFFEALH